MSRFEDHIRELAREEAVKVVREALDAGAGGAPVLPGSGESGEEVAAVESPAPAVTVPSFGGRREFDCMIPGHRVRVIAWDAESAADIAYEAHGTWPFEVIEVQR